MTLVLDPVWPWGRLYELLVQTPPAVRAVALMAAVAALGVPAAWLAKKRNMTLALLGVVGLSLVLVLGHLRPLAMADGYASSSSGFVGFVAGVAWLLGLMVLLLAPSLLAGLSVAAYVGTAAISRPKVIGVVVLRLLAFLLALVALARPALAWSEREQASSVLYVFLDGSRSMTIQDEPAKRSRWEHLLIQLKSCDTALKDLRDDQGVEVRWHAFDAELRDFDPKDPGTPDGKRTDFGVALQQLFDRRDAARPARGLLVVSDGADNGLNVPALGEAARWRGAPCTIHTFACGNPRTSSRQNDVAIVSISTAPQPFVPVKGRLSVKVTIDARGFENSKARVKLFLENEGRDVEATAKDVTLPLTTGNEVTLTADAPARPGEVKVKVVVETAEQDNIPLNNSIETFVTVSKEGISVLLVDKLRNGEPQAICDALAEDARVRVTPLWLAGGRPIAGSNAARLFAEQDVPYDVIILGDVSIEALKAADERAAERIAKLVGRGSGLIVLGGLTNLGNGGWQGTPLEPLLPVDLSMKEQVDGPVRMLPTDDGLRRMRYLFRLDEREQQKEAWEDLAKKASLDGATKLQPKQGALVLARGNDAEKGEPLLVFGQYSGGEKEKPGEAGAARVLVFGGDTTHRWVRNERFAEFFSRWWRQAVVWLAKQEDAEGQVWVRPDVRRLPVRSELGFAVGLRGKGGGPEVRDGKYEVEVITPTGQRVKTPVTRGATENRGTFTDTQAPGVYRVVVRGEGTDPSGGKVSGEATARVIVYDEDAEMSRPAADPEFLAKLAAAGGGGEASRVEELPNFLSNLAERPPDPGRARMSYRPDWQTRGRSPFLMLFFAAFGAVVCLEWGLRRWWGLK